MAATFTSFRAALALASLLASGASHGAERLIALTRPPALEEDVDAAPKIERPRDATERRINTALALYDAQSRGEWNKCRETGGADFEWRRSIKPTMRGPLYLSFTVFTYGSCGGAHPWAQTSAIILDLVTGARAEWKKLLPSRLIGKQDPDKSKGVEMPSLVSKRLHELYLQAYRKGDHADDPQCLKAVETADDVQPWFQAWLDADAGGLGYVMLLSDFEKACMDEFVLPLETLRKEGAPATLLGAIAAAHAARPPTPPTK